MADSFIPIACNRATYYCKGSPVHFAMVELFKMQSTGSTVVTFTFKNLYSRPLKKLTVHYRCKNAQGNIIGEDDFDYSNLKIAEGICFGQDEGVFISDEPLSSVEVSLVSVIYDDDILHSLKKCPPIALPPLQKLSATQKDTLYQALRSPLLRYYPQEVADGWRCACGGFNYNAGIGKLQCTECDTKREELFTQVQRLGQ